jgi:hypothetical protein
MSWDLNQQAKAFLICLGVPWLFVVVTVLLMCVLVVLEWFGVVNAYAE